jgi:hypothetical protein
MGQVIGTFIFVIIALVVVSAVGSLILSALGVVFWLIPVLIKLGIWAGLIYLGYLLFRKFARATN